MKKFISILLCCIMCTSICPFSYALESQDDSINSVASAYSNTPEDISDENKSIEEMAAELQETLPEGSEISISNGEINVFVSEPIESYSLNLKSNNSIQALATTTNSILAPAGGSYRSFQPQLNQSVQPYSMIYLPADEAKAFVCALNDSSLLNYIITWAGTSTAEVIATKVAAKFALDIPPAGISFLIAIGSYAVLQQYDASMAMKAFENSSTNKISITRVTSSGMAINYYFVWNSNYVSASPYELWNPVFYRGVYDI